VWNTDYWNDHQVPVLTPEIFFFPPETAFIALQHALDTCESDDDREIIVASMRAVVVLCFVVDYRVRAWIMVYDPDTHGRMHTLPPARDRVWTFLEKAPVKLYADGVKTILEGYGLQTAQKKAMWMTLDIVKTLYKLYVMRVTS